MSVNKETIGLSMSRVMHPVIGRDFAAIGGVKKVAYCDGYASVTLAGGGLSAEQRAVVQQHATAAVRLLGKQSGETVNEVLVQFTEDVPSGAGVGAASEEKAAVAARPSSAQHQAQAGALPGVKHAIAVGAGKGGVGKSTVAVNLAVGLARRGHTVGLLDGDIYGPSLPTMLGLGLLDPVVIEGMIQPFAVHGLKAMTIGKLVDPEKPLIWRGPMAHGAFKQLVEQTRWGELDYLVIDLPPGTGDVSLTMAQVLKLTGAVVVCTPQKVAQDDAVRAARMFQQLGIEILGVVENMSYFMAEDVEPAREYDIFGRGGAQMMAQRLGLPFLGALPITLGLRERSDSGDPTGNFEAGGAMARELESMVTNVENQVTLAGFRSGARTPTLTIS